MPTEVLEMFKVFVLPVGNF